MAGEGGVKLSTNDAVGRTSISSTLDLGSVARPFDIGASALAATEQIPDLRFTGNITGSGGLIKMGAGELKLEGAANSFTGQLEVQAGKLRFNSANALTGVPTVLVSGGDLDVQGYTQTVGAVTMTGGKISGSTVLPGTVAAPSFLLNPATNAKVSAILADSGGASALVKSGAGIASLTVDNTYTGGTTVNAGTLVFDTKIPNGPVSINGGTLKVQAKGTPNSPSGTSVVNSLSISPARSLDLTNNSMVIDYTGAPARWRTTFASTC